MEIKNKMENTDLRVKVVKKIDSDDGNRYRESNFTFRKINLQCFFLFTALYNTIKLKPEINVNFSKKNRFFEYRQG